VRGVQPDFKLLAKVPVRGTIVTAPSADPRFDFVSRFFAPAAGFDEDPATGSSHCCLGPYWGEHLRKHTLLGRQLSRRGGTIGVELAGERVTLLGQAVTVMRVELLTG
jgi:predicted PhzF superfamily epimerase YddE/YHI9